MSTAWGICLPSEEEPKPKSRESRSGLKGLDLVGRKEVKIIFQTGQSWNKRLMGENGVTLGEE